MTDIIKVAADFLREEFADRGIMIGSSHAHAAVAAYLGYNSKKALLDDNEFPSHEEELVLRFPPDLEKLTERIGKMKPTALQSVPIDLLAETVKTGLTPKCECCSEKKRGIQPVTNPDDDSPDGWVCRDCASSEEDYGWCRFCGFGIIYRAENINERGECPIHNGESVMDEEEQQDWEDYAEYLMKDLGL